MALMAATFVGIVLRSSQVSMDQLLRLLPSSGETAASSDAEDPAIRGDTVAPGAATVPETTANRTDEAEDPRPGGVAFDAAFVHRAAPENIIQNSTYLDDPLINGDPDAILYVTQNWNPGGSRGTYNDHPIGVWYDANRLRWAIFNQDLAAMPEGAAFNVVVLKDSTEAV